MNLKDKQLLEKYCNDFPAEVKERLVLLYQVIRDLVPDAEFCMNYAMPTFKLNGNLVHFAGYKNHIGFYPSPSVIKAFEDKLIKYNYSKGAIQFPHSKAIPLKLIKDIVKFRVKENTL